MDEQYNYRGENALIYLRVSSEEQKKKYGFASQLASINEKLIKKLGIVYKEEHIIRDAYTGMIFRERPELKRILEMADNHEFTIVIMDTLDRLGRKGLQRELYRAELRERGIRILTTEPGERADDDSLMGEMVRLLYGFKAEQERNDIVRRTLNGRKERAKEGKLIPSRVPLYGYLWGDPEVGGKTHYIYHPEQRPVVERMFRMVIEGFSARSIARQFTLENIPTPEGKKTPEGNYSWVSSTIHRLLKHPFYMGEVSAFRYTGNHDRGYIHMVLADKKDQIKISDVNVVQPIVTPEIFQKAQECMEKHKRYAPRNNKNPESGLLRCGFIHCGYCNYAMSVATKYTGEKCYSYYRCYKSKNADNGLINCKKGISLSCYKVDNVVWDKVLTIIKDPKQVDEKLEELKKQDPTDNRQKILKKITELKKSKTNLQNNLNAEMEKEEMDPDTVVNANRRIKELGEIIKEGETELHDAENSHKKWNELQDRLIDFHNTCTQMRVNIDDPEYTPSYQDKRKAIEFLGIHASITGTTNEPIIKMTVDPPSIMSLST